MSRSLYVRVGILLLVAGIRLFASDVDPVWEPAPACDHLSGTYSVANIGQGFRACCLDSGLRLNYPGETTAPLDLLFSPVCKERPEDCEPFSTPVSMDGEIEYLRTETALSIAMRSRGLLLDYSGMSGPRFTLKGPWWPELDESPAILHLSPNEGPGFDLLIESALDASGVSLDVRWVLQPIEEGRWVIGLSDPSGEAIFPVAVKMLLKAGAVYSKENKVPMKSAAKNAKLKTDRNPADQGPGILAAPAIFSISPGNGPTTGGGLINLSGSFVGGSGNLYFNGGSISYMSWTDTLITFVCPPGQGFNIPVYVSNGEGTSNTVFFSYNPPSISGLDPNNGPTAGGTLVTLSGMNFGTIGTVSLNGTICPPQSWSHTQITFLTPPGEGINLPVVVTTGGQSSNTVLFSYDPPAITAIDPSHGPTAGGTLVTLSGMNFGASGVLMFNGANCVHQSWSHTQISFFTPAGQGTNLPVVVTAGGQTSNTVSFSYDPPAITAIDPNHGPTAGGTLVTLDGVNFGASGTLMFNGAICVPQSWGHTQITFLTPPGQGTNLPVVVTAGGQTSNTVSFSYDPPAIIAIDPNHGPTAGGTPVTVYGMNFGTSGSVTLGGNPVAIQSWADAQVTFLTPPGQGTNLPIVVTAGGRPSNSLPFSYDPPVIFGLAPPNGSTAGGTEVVLSGANFGLSGTVTLNGIICLPKAWTHNYLSFLTPEGQVFNLPIVVTVGGQISNSVLFSYQPPNISGRVPTHGPAAGGTEVLMSGTNFGTSGTVTVNSVPGTPQGWTHTHLSFLTPPGEGINLPVVVTVGGQASPPVLFSYDPPRETAPASGSSDILRWTAGDTLSWPVNPDALGGYRLYRGPGPDLPALLTTGLDSCLRGVQPDQNGPTFANLMEVPGETQGNLFWYLVTGVNASGEGIAGYASSGLRQLDSRGVCE